MYRKVKARKRIFEKIKKNKPRMLYIISDGPRNAEDYQDVMEIREFLDASVDWTCDLKKLYREKNYGLRYGIPAGLDYVFENEDRAIIIEDDIDFSDLFFDYCNRALDAYKDNDNVMVVTGYNPFSIVDGFGKNDVCFSKIFSVWGWATWKRAWVKYENNIPRWHALRNRRKVFGFMNNNTYRFYKSIFNDLQFQWYNSWGYQWKFAVWVSDGYVITPRYNYIINIGMFDNQAEHKEKENKGALLENSVKLNEEDCCNEFPRNIIYNSVYDDQYQKFDIKKEGIIELIKSDLREKIHYYCRKVIFKMEKNQIYFDYNVGEKYKLSEEFRDKNQGRIFKETSAKDLREIAKTYILYSIFQNSFSHMS